MTATWPCSVVCRMIVLGIGPTFIATLTHAVVVT